MAQLLAAIPDPIVDRVPYGTGQGYVGPPGLLQTTDYRLPTTYCRLPTADYQLPTANCQLPTAYCQLPTANCLLPTAYCLLPTASPERRLTGCDAFCIEHVQRGRVLFEQAD